MTYSDFALYVSSPDIKSLKDKTIHKAKGAEFENVLVVLGEEANIKFLTEPKLDDTRDEQRVYYVAVSRATKRLAICVSTLSKENENTLATLPIDIKRI
jgi:ATP-dependent DNA helicase, uvrD/REP family